MALRFTPLDDEKVLYMADATVVDEDANHHEEAYTETTHNVLAYGLAYADKYIARCMERGCAHEQLDWDDKSIDIFDGFADTTYTYIKIFMIAMAFAIVLEVCVRVHKMGFSAWSRNTSTEAPQKKSH